MYSNIKIISKNPKKFSVQISKAGETKHVKLGNKLAFLNYLALVEQANKPVVVSSKFDNDAYAAIFCKMEE